jgi:hypothetical protein
MSGVIFEIVVAGDAAKVTAVDEATGTEAVAVGPAGAARADLEALALRKLQRMLAKTPAAPVVRKGRLV